MKGRLSVLLVGEFWYGSLSYFCKRAFQSLGHHVSIFDTSRFTGGENEFVLFKGLLKVTRSFSTSRLNKALLAYLKKFSGLHIDFVLFVKATSYFPEALESVRQLMRCPLFDWHTDDYFHPKVATPHALQCIPFYDCIFTVEKFNVPELLNSGAEEVVYLPMGYDPDLHRPTKLSPQEREIYATDCVFVGSWRKDRAEILESLVTRSFPYSLMIWGNSWHKLSLRSPLRRCVKYKAIYGLEMSKAISGAKIALAFVTRFGNGRSVHTMRTFEIPACKGFMLAEHASGEYHEFFGENEEMACFGNGRTLREQIDYYLAHAEERERIAESGYLRLRNSNYSYTNRVEKIIDVYQKLK